MNPFSLYLHSLKNIEVREIEIANSLESITFQKSISNWVSLIRTNYYVNYILYLVVIAFVISIILIIVLYEII